MQNTKGFTTFELILVITIISIIATAGNGAYRVYTKNILIDRAERDNAVLLRALDDRFLNGDPCNTTLPADCPTTSPFGTAYTVSCLKNGYTVTFDIPTEYAGGIRLPNKVATVVNASTSKIALSKSAPFIADGGFQKRYLYGQ